MGEVAEFTGGKVPAALSKLAGDNDDLSSGVRGGYGVVSIRGSKFHIKSDGEETTVLNDDGDPVGSLRFVLLKASPNVSKNFYEGGYETGSSEGPSCWSIAGDVPDPNAPNKQADTCAACPNNQFGSRITDAGKKIKACSDSRRIAVIPENDFANEVYGGPMLLRVPASSLSNLAQYGKKMKHRGYPYNTILTRCSFDVAASFPKLEFNAVRPLTDDEANEIINLLAKPDFADKITAVLATDLEVVPVAAVPEEELFEEPVKVKPAAKKAAPKPAKTEPKTPEVVEEDESDDALDDDLAAILGSLDNLD
jgi:hypothetical protein